MTTMARHIRDSYLDLVKQMPLVPIKNEEQYEDALTFLKKLAIRNEGSLDEGQQAYLEALTQFVGDYEDKHLRAEIGYMKPLQALKYLMKVNGMRPADLGRLLGNRSLASQILHGNRSTSKTHIRLLSERFKVEPGIFFK